MLESRERMKARFYMLSILLTKNNTREREKREKKKSLMGRRKASKMWK
jgi:hypothetical protein